MAHTNLVANELKAVGFKAQAKGNAVEVSLSNRKPSKMEVETALEQVFDSIQFEVRSTNNSVLVSWS